MLDVSVEKPVRASTLARLELPFCPDNHTLFALLYKMHKP